MEISAQSAAAQPRRHASQRFLHVRCRLHLVAGQPERGDPSTADDVEAFISENQLNERAADALRAAAADRSFWTK